MLGSVMRVFVIFLLISLSSNAFSGGYGFSEDCELPESLDNLDISDLDSSCEPHNSNPSLETDVAKNAVVYPPSESSIEVVRGQNNVAEEETEIAVNYESQQANIPVPQDMTEKVDSLGEKLFQILWGIAFIIVLIL